jgi:outer membrane protein TolC
MAADYLQLRGLDAQTRLLAATIADLQDQLDLTQRRLAGGIGTEVDVAQARTQLETVRAQLVDLGVARAQYEHAIGTIANLNLSAFSIPFSPLDLALPKLPLGVPSQLLERRPDIAAAERRAAAANAQIGIAVSAFYPTITLNGTGGFESMNAGTWIQGPSALWSLGAQGSGTPLRRRPPPRPHRPGPPRLRSPGRGLQECRHRRLQRRGRPALRPEDS